MRTALTQANDAGASLAEFERRYDLLRAAVAAEVAQLHRKNMQ